MITFVPSWQGASSGEVSTDDLIGLIQSLQSTQEDYRLIVGDYLPNLRYFLHRFGLLESHYVSLFDQLQGFEGTFQAPLTLEDLDFPQGVHYAYTPFSILVYERGQLLGEVFQAEGAHISEVRHFKEGNLISSSIYDDRGFLSSRRIFEDGVHTLTEYLDREGSCIFVHFQEDDGCAVNYENTRGLVRKYYESLDALVFECLEAELRRQAASKIVLSVKEKNRELVSRSIFLEQMVLSYFDRRIALSNETNYLDQFLVQHSRAVVVNSEVLYHGLEEFSGERKTLHKISPFDTRFTLSASQEMKEEVLYWDSRQQPLQEAKDTVAILFDFMVERMTEEERSFKVVVRVNPDQAAYLPSFYTSLVRDHFPEEMALIDERGLDSVGENGLEDVFLKDFKTRVFFVKALLESFEVEPFVNDEKLFKILHETRLVLDLGTRPDLFTQIAGISSGLPQINRVATDYVLAQKNGHLITELQELPEVLAYYLDSLRTWQSARVHSVQQMKRFSGQALSRKVLNLFKGEANG